MIRADFECATKTFWLKHEFRGAELTPEGTLYQMRAKALSALAD